MKKIKYLWVFGGNTRNGLGFLNMIHDRDDIDSHHFFIPFVKAYQKNYPELQKFENFTYMCDGGYIKRALFCYRLFMQAEHIILHGLYAKSDTLFLLYFVKKFRKSLAWVEWGADLYNWKYEETSLKNKIKNWIGRKVRESAKVIGLMFPADEDFLRAEFNTNAICREVPFPSLKNTLEIADRLKPSQSGTKQRVLIQVGHNAYQFGNHIQLLSMLEQYKDQPIKVVLPLAYGAEGIYGRNGGRNYCKAVMRTSYQIFGKKSAPFTKEIPLENFYQYLWHTDILVFGFKRASAIGNLLLALYMGKKVFLPSDSACYKYFVKQGLVIYDTLKIPEMSFEEFAEPVKEQNISWLKYRYDKKRTLRLWEEFLSIVDQTK